MKFTRKKIILGIIFIFAIGFICLLINRNTGLKAFEKEVLNIELPQNIEKIAMKSGIGDSGGNGDYSTYRVVFIAKTEMTIDELKKEFDNKEMTTLTHKAYSGLPFAYITKCEGSVFKSSRDFVLEFDELKGINDFSNYYFIEFIN